MTELLGGAPPAGASPVLPDGLPIPVPAANGLDAPYWEGTVRHELLVQRCPACATYLWGPEFICHQCLRFEPDWVQVDATGVLYSWERVWHAVSPTLAAACPYVVVLVELPHAGDVRMIGNLVGDPLRDLAIGTSMRAVFEDRHGPVGRYTLVQWELGTD